MKSTVPSKKRGGVLVIVVVIMVAFTLMVAALLQLGSFNEMETSKSLRTTQAHWIAEAGLERALSWIMASEDYRSSLPNTFNSNETLLAGMGSYNITLSSTSTSNALLTQYTIQSTGTVSNNALTETVTVQLGMRASSGNITAISAPGDNAISTISANPTIEGPIYVKDELVIENGVKPEDLDGEIDVGTLSGGGADAATTGTFPTIPAPILDQTPYTTLLDYAADTNNSEVLIGTQTSGTLTFNGSTLYINGDLKINGDIPAGETIVITGEVSGEKSGQTINGGTGIVSGGDVTFKNHVILAEQVEIFTQSDIIFDTSGGGGSLSEADGATLLALGDIITKNIDFNGIIYAEGRVEVTSGSDINGTIIAWQGFDLDANVTVTYDSSVFADPNPIDFGDSLAIQTDSWVWQVVRNP